MPSANAHANAPVNAQVDAQPDTVRRAPDVADSQVFGAVLVLAGVLLLLLRTEVIDLGWRSVVAVLLAALGLGMLVTVHRRTSPLPLVVGGVMTLALVSASSIDVGVLDAGVGERSIMATTVDEARRDSRIGVGKITADLRNLDVPVGRTSLAYDVGVGDLEVVLPDDPSVGVRITGTVRVGELDALGRAAGKGDVRRVVTSENYRTAERRIDLKVSVGVGNAKVSRDPVSLPASRDGG